MARKKQDLLLMRQLIKDYWFSGMSERQISRVLLEKNNIKLVPAAVHFQLKKIQREMEFEMDEETFEKYIAEYTRIRFIFESEIEEIDQYIERLNPDDPRHIPEIVKLIKQRHEIRNDILKVLQDYQLPIAVKKFKKERERFAGTLQTVKEEPVVKLVLPETTPTEVVPESVPTEPPQPTLTEISEELKPVEVENDVYEEAQ